MKTIKLFGLLFLGLTFATSCSDDDDPEPVNEEEVITTLRITLTPDGGGSDVIFESRDLDGDGPDAPIVTTGDLAAFTTYSGVVEVLNELETPPEIKTPEILEEDEEHQFFYEFITSSGADVTYDDQDGNGNPIGQMIELTTASASQNTLVVTLLHEPDKDAQGVSAGDATNAGGETDISVTFSFAVN